MWNTDVPPEKGLPLVNKYSIYNVSISITHVTYCYFTIGNEVTTVRSEKSDKSNFPIKSIYNMNFLN